MAEGNELTLAKGTSKRSVSENDNYVLLAAIDFGTTFSGYAFSFASKPEDIKSNKEWGNEVGAKSYKTPTCILTDDKDKFVAFGYEALNKYAQEVDAEKRLHLYDRFKMVLYREKIFGSKTTIMSRGGRTIPAEMIISMALNYMYNHILNAIKHSDTSKIDTSLIRWVLTVPAIWSESGKQLMRRAALKAGITDTLGSKKLLIALEPEAASFWCRSLPLSQFVGTDRNAKTLQVGDKYMIVDCGGGTIDITVHETTSDGVKEVHRATGGDWGGTKVDDNFLKLMDDLLGEDFTIMYQRKYPQDWLNLLVNFETVKRSFTVTDSKSMNITLTYNLADVVEDEKDKSLKKIIKDAQLEGVSFSQGMLVLDPKRVAMIFNPVISKITSHIEGLLRHRTAQNVTYMFLVGGFADCELLSTEIRKKFGKVRNVLVPQDSGLSVVKGAVLFGHNPARVVCRIARRTYGEELRVKFIEGVHDPAHKVVVDGIAKSVRAFRKWLTMNEMVTPGTSRVFESYPRRQNQIEIETRIYSVDREDVIHVTEPGVVKIGELRIDIPDAHIPKYERVIKTHVFFGDTEIYVRVEDVARPNGDVKEMSIDLLDN